MTALGLWMNGARVGTWSRTRGGADRLAYARDWPDSVHGRPLSLSLPFTANLQVQGPRVSSYFDNLLPDSDIIRARIQQRMRLPDVDVMTLLGAIGRDCVGALQVLGEDEEPPPAGTLDYDELDDAGVARALANVTDDDPGDTPDGEPDFDDLRISIAGAQEKTALLRVGDTWCRPKGATPTTHLMKLPLGIIGGDRPDGGVDFRLSVENEWVCLRLMHSFGLPVAEAQIGRFGERKALVVERFDRQWTDDRAGIIRLPQEDFCQATGTSWRNKYEGRPELAQAGAAGPGIRQCLNILGGSDNAAVDKANFAMAQFGFWLLAATDGHAKNFSLFIGRGGSIALTPFYDVISLWPSIGAGANLLTTRRNVKLAMALRGRNVHRHLHQILPRHWQGLANNDAGLPAVFGRMVELAETMRMRLDLVEGELPAGFPAQLWETIRGGVTYQAERFLRLHAGTED